MTAAAYDRRASDAAYRASHFNEARAYYDRNRERIAARMAAYHASRPAKLTRRLAKRTELFAALKAGPCMDCGVSYPPCVMDFDHRPGEQKVRGVAKMLHSSVAVVLAEVEKCDLVCANCHRVRTRDRANGGR